MPATNVGAGENHNFCNSATFVPSKVCCSKRENSRFHSAVERNDTQNEKWYWVTESQKILGQKGPLQVQSTQSWVPSSKFDWILLGLDLSRAEKFQGQRFQSLSGESISIVNHSCCECFYLDLLKIPLAATCDCHCATMCDNIQMHLLCSPHVGSKSGFSFPLDSSSGWNKSQIFLCIKHSHPLTVLMALHSIYSSFSTSPLYKEAQMGPHKGEVTSLDLPVTFLLMQPSTQVSTSPHCTLPQLIKWVRLTCFPLVHVRGVIYRQLG